ncbi:L domain-like protein [Piromyces finnis]|uniref:L domain-like protein n=1 Tax=Piromyces finnis TaxID=1754191 RepID=A0A1Y1VMF7_9FUNG|nr:L domain-like protein [Piromyces finnis]|eukprot:ORX60105.1 L domain-like protein [Piromyces finnis]
MFVSGKKLCILLSAIGSALAAASDECGFVNSLLGNDEGYNCCAKGYPSIKCSADHITYIDLSNKDIEMAFPSIDSLPELTVLNLSGNKISGSLPDLSGLENLIQLDISDNQIEGSLPESIEKLTNLKILKAGGNRISDVSEKLTSLSLLTDLDLSNNGIEGSLPTFLSKIPNLKYLNLSKNSFSGPIPEDITSISNLISLNLSKNSLEEVIPSSISNLKNLRFLDLSENKLSGYIPTTEFEKLNNIASINLESNLLLVGKIPKISYDSNDYSCKFRDTNLCYLESEKRTKCKYTNYECSKCVENATLKDNMCTCNDGFIGVGYVLCTDDLDINLNQGSENASNFRATFQSITLATIVLLASYVLNFM